LLERLRLAFEVRGPHVDETPLAREAPRATALRLAQAKARAVAPAFPGALVIGCDQVAELEGACVGKPGNHENAVAQLKAMRGKDVVFHTALALFNAGSGLMQTAEVPTAVRFRRYADDEIERYLALEQPYDCAGSAKTEGLGIALIERMETEDPTSLVGLPLIALTAMLERAGLPVL
jgi:septum formation protein